MSNNPYFKQQSGHGRAPGGGSVQLRTPTQAPVPVQRQHSPGLPIPGQRNRKFEADRVVEAGGALAFQLLLKTTPVFERLWRRLPEEGMFSSAVSPSNPFVFELGAFTVPERMALLVFDVRPDIYRFSGVDAGDFVPIEARRFGSIMGFELTVEQEHQGNIQFQIDPVQIQRTSQQAFVSNNIVNPQFNTTQQAIGGAATNANTQGSSSMILPQRPTRYGAPAPLPFTIYAGANQTVQARCSIFRPIPTPIAFVEFDLSGYLVPLTFSDNLQEIMKFPQDEGQEYQR